MKVAVKESWEGIFGLKGSRNSIYACLEGDSSNTRVQHRTRLGHVSHGTQCPRVPDAVLVALGHIITAFPSPVLLPPFPFTR